MRTCNSCQENEPGIIWIEFYSMKDVERLLTIMVKSLGDRIQRYPEINDWFCYRILGHEGEKLAPWRFEAYPNLSSTSMDQDIYPNNVFSSRIELSISARFPREDKQMVLDLVTKYLRKGQDNFEELSDERWDYVKQFVPMQPLKGHIRTDDRRIIDGIRYLFETGCPWTEVPRKYGSYISIRTRLKRWSEEGALEPILRSIGSDEVYRKRLSNYFNEPTIEPTVSMAPKQRMSTNQISKGEMASMSLSQ